MPVAVCPDCGRGIDAIDDSYEYYEWDDRHRVKSSRVVCTKCDEIIIGKYAPAGDSINGSDGKDALQ